MKTLINISKALLIFSAFILILYGCKKADMHPLQTSETNTDYRAKAIAAVKAKNGNVSAGFIYTINKQADVFYKNNFGKMVKLYQGSSFGGENQSSACPQYNCTNTTNPANLSISYTLNYVQRFYKCEDSSKSRIEVNWTANVPFIINFAVQDTLISNTYGTIKFSPSGGSSTTITNAAGTGDFSVKQIGTSCVNKIYSITYSFDSIPNSYMLSGTTVEAAISLDNDCSLISYLSASGLTAAPGITDELDLPCERVDKVWINPNTGPNNCTTVTGNYVICSAPSGLTTVDYHEVEYRLVTSGSSLKWDDQTGSVFWGEPTGTGTPNEKLNPSTGVSNLVNMTPSSGIWLVRFKNIKTSSCDLIYSFGTNPSPGPANANGDWLNPALWIVEVWTL